MHGTKDRPRLFVYRSNQHIYVQLVDDDKAKILMSASDKDLKSKKGNKSELAKEVGKLIAKKAIENIIKLLLLTVVQNTFIMNTMDLFY